MHCTDYWVLWVSGRRGEHGIGTDIQIPLYIYGRLLAYGLGGWDLECEELKRLMMSISGIEGW